MMRAVHQIVGNTTCAWNASTPLAWTMTETKGKGDNRRTERRSFDLTPLTQAYERRFLLHLKNALILRRQRITLPSIHAEYSHIRRLLGAMQASGVLTAAVTQIDQAFIASIRTILDRVNGTALYCLRRLFAAQHESPVFAPGLLVTDFPLKHPKRGITGDLISRILAKALTRAACIEVLRVTEDAYETGAIDIGLFSFIHLAFHIYCRPSSYRQLTLADLQIDVHPESKVTTYYLWVFPAKTRIHVPGKIPYRLNRFAGELLEAQRIHVIKTYGHLVNEKDIGKLALFPARRLNKSGNWCSTHAKSYHGETDYQAFWAGYLKPIIRLQQSVKFDFNALRHTVGTQLAESGCTAQTIRAVLKHAGYQVCQAYVDIAFHGLINQLSDAMEPAFESHFPVFKKFRSKNEPIELQKAIRSEDLETGRIELTGECGRLVACQYAPLACYPCPRFIPCYDADHGINLAAINADIAKYKGAGLPFAKLLERAKDARRYILLVLAAAEQKRYTLEQESNV